jgi:hypothetical protein
MLKSGSDMPLYSHLLMKGEMEVVLAMAPNSWLAPRRRRGVVYIID